MNEKISLGIIGCGQIAQAFLGGLVKLEGLLERVALYDLQPERSQVLAALDPVAFIADSALEAATGVEIILLAVKPPQIKPVLRQIAPCLLRNQVVVSIAAGISLDVIANELGEGRPAVRVMPNIPALVGQGAFAMSFSAAVADTQKDRVVNMFSAIGMVEEVPEAYMDAVTALSGSGPAFIFLVAEAMTDAAVNVGLPRDLARRLTDQTILGSVTLLKQTGQHPAALREMVTSPGGTTIAGLKELETGGLRGAFFEAIMAAYRRSAGL